MSLLTKIKWNILKSDPIAQMSTSLLRSDWIIIDVSPKDVLVKSGYNILIIRKEPSTDFAVFKQVFLEKEYDPVCSFFKDNNLDCKFIVDAGSNVGYSLLKFKSYFPQSKIIAIEADENNFKNLLRNIELNKLTDTIPLYNALHNIEGLPMYITADFRGGGDWAKRTNVSTEKTTLSSITVNSVIEKYETEIIDLIKIDIEGAEQYLFDSIESASCLSKTKVLAIEIHDEFNIRKKIYEILRHYSFVIVNYGETTLAVNKNYI